MERVEDVSSTNLFVVAEVCALYFFVEEDGVVKPGVSLIVALDLPGVTKGKAL